MRQSIGFDLGARDEINASVARLAAPDSAKRVNIFVAIAFASDLHPLLAAGSAAGRRRTA